MKDETLLPDDVLAICQRLIKEYIANKGTSSEFICCVTPSRKTIGTGGVWDDWKALDKAVTYALQSGNSAQPVTVPAGYVLVPVEPTPEMCDVGHIGIDVLTGVTSDSEYYSTLGDSAAKLYRAMLAAAPKAPGSQLTPTPEDRLQKAIIDACIVFLHDCDSLSKNYECDFSDSETELSFCIANVAKKIGVVEETGNRRWSLSQQMRDEINGVYRKYAMRIMEAAPKVKP